MNITESTQIVDFVAATKGTEPTEKTYLAWHMVLEGLGFEQARQAALRVLQDPSINFIEPKHILAKASVLVEEAKTEERRQRAMQELEPVQSTPMPKCKHDKGLLYCDPCCHEAAIEAGLIEPRPYTGKKTFH